MSFKDEILKHSLGVMSEARVEHKVDSGTCAVCGWSGLLSSCETEDEGDWETGYFPVPMCPTCEDGGCIDDYYASER
jgi:hypothetical protein